MCLVDISELLFKLNLFLMLCTTDAIVFPVNSNRSHVTPFKRPPTAEERLIVDLFDGYDTDSRGVMNGSSTVAVVIQFMLLRIQKLVSSR